jgi:GT2 family glycosyltransferase
MHSAHIDVSILVVSYNTCAMTRAALDSILTETKDVSYEVIAVDNASSDESASMIAAHPLHPEFIRLTENIGFARANNLAAKRARGRYILLLNPDTLVLDSAIDKLVAFAKCEPKARIWGGRTLYANGSLNPSSCWGRMTLWNLFCRASGLTGLFPGSELFNGEAYGGWKRNSVRNIDIVSGCFFLIEKELWDGLNGFDPLFFMYGEEADLCLRAHAFSARPMISPHATIIHYGGASETARAGKMVRLLAAKVSLVDRHWQPLLVPLGHALLIAWPLTRLVATSVSAAMVPSASNLETAEAWRLIWRRRNEWQHGYANPTKTLTAPSALAPST